MFESQHGQATEGKSTAGSQIHGNNDGEEESGVLQLERQVSIGDLIWVKLHRNSWWPALVVDENGVSASYKPGNRSEGEVLVRLYGSYDYLYADLKKYYSEFKMVLGQNNGNLYEIFDKALEKDCTRIKSLKPRGKGSKSTANKGADASKGKKKLNQNQADESNPDAVEHQRLISRRNSSEKRPSTDKQAKNKANEQERVKKKQRKNNQIVEKMKPNTGTAKEAIKQSAMPKKMPKSSNSARRKRSKTSKQSEEPKKGKPNSPISDCTSSISPKQDKKANSQSSERTSPRKSPKSSARRMRVMQGLGLTAPPGSPFQKN